MQALKTYRKDKKLSQKAAAESVGVFRETWARWESGAHKISAERLPVVSEKTGIPKRELRPDLAEVMREST
jgi:transcriptional regulator with XRE-family HTH domain